MSCKGCAYRRGIWNCVAMKQQYPTCWNNTSEIEAKKREKAIMKYKIQYMEKHKGDRRYESRKES